MPASDHIQARLEGTVTNRGRKDGVTVHHLRVASTAALVRVWTRDPEQVLIERGSRVLATGRLSIIYWTSEDDGEMAHGIDLEVTSVDVLQAIGYDESYGALREDDLS